MVLNLLRSTIASGGECSRPKPAEIAITGLSEPNREVGISGCPLIIKRKNEIERRSAHDWSSISDGKLSSSSSRPGCLRCRLFSPCRAAIVGADVGNASAVSHNAQKPKRLEAVRWPDAKTPNEARYSLCPWTDSHFRRSNVQCPVGQSHSRMRCKSRPIGPKMGVSGNNEV